MDHCLYLVRLAATEPHRYYVYGLLVSSSREIPGLAGVPETAAGFFIPDIQVDLIGPLPGRILPTADTIPHFNPDSTEDSNPFFQVSQWGGPEGTRHKLRFARGDVFAEFQIDAAGARMWISWAAGVPYRDVVPLLLGPALGCALRIRGVTCLHASVIAANEGAAIVILDPKGTGKSTVAAALAQRGSAVVADDIAALAETGGVFRVQPGCLRLRLWPGSAEALPGLAADDLPRVLSFQEKRYLDLSLDRDTGPWRFQAEPLPLAAVYLLGQPGLAGAAPSITALPAAEGIIALTRNTYAAYILDREGRAREFKALGRLAGTVPLRRVNRPLGLERLPETADMILSDALNLILCH